MLCQARTKEKGVTLSSIKTFHFFRKKKNFHFLQWMMLHRKTKEEKIENSLDLLYTNIPTVFNIGPKHLLH